MALTQRHRSSIFGALAPIMGEEEAEALLSQFPTHDLEQPVTKEFVRAELAVTRAEIQAEIGALRTELHDEIGALRTELHDEIGALRVEMHQLVQRQTMWLVATIVAVGGLLGAFGSL